MNTEVMFSSKTDQWATPQDFFDKLNEEFHFTLDPCADEFNHKCEKYYTKEDDGLKQSWQNERVFCNPPYGREIGKWVEKAYAENMIGGAYVECLSLQELIQNGFTITYTTNLMWKSDLSKAD